ncbi:hypothetical protein Taro_028140 [Colocasia esculenta]|uniref:Leucine-rich repeat-containing N-terminal plant-type domain-containing protein n=1 Tax=Colocasia esculenta TaxID=4460 RepID=A0A843VM87_COLES|nr:hypothetical protein [Colocasia esculenta]
MRAAASPAAVSGRQARPPLAPPHLFRRLLVVSLCCCCCCFQDLRSEAQTLPQQEVDALKQIAGKLKIPPTLWDFRLDPCTGWSPWSRTKYIVSNLTCDCNTTSDACHVVGMQAPSSPPLHSHTCIDPAHGAEPDGDAAGGVRQPHFPGSDVGAHFEISGLSFIFNSTLLDLTRNYINGSIPAAAWASLPLVNVSLMGNRLSGPIPEAIGNITTLQWLTLEDNMLQGSLPRSLGNLTSLTRLLLDANNFTGELPETLGNLKNLTDLYAAILFHFRIDGNDISGKIPSFIGNWTKLTRFDMQGTALEGPFPSALSLLQNLIELRVTDLKKSDGGFPPIKDMPKMRHLVLRNCSISGQIPRYLGTMPRLRILYGSSN